MPVGSFREPITEDCLRSLGFKYELMNQTPTVTIKHWILWMGCAVAEKTAFSSEDLGVELAHGNVDEGWWYCWIRADYCGRYSRFVHIRHLRWLQELADLIAALTGFPFDPANSMYGSYHKPEQAERLRVDYAKRMEVQLAKDWGSRAMHETDQDPDGRDKVRP